jgi:methyltransferase (TIGR00027 family)
MNHTITHHTNIVRRGEPSRSALGVATLRAVHQLLDEPLVLPDPVALPLLGASTEAALRDDPYALNDPISRALRAAVVARSRFVEDRLAIRVAAGVRQYVVLGAGLDTFAYRNPFRDEGLRVFEVDHPGTQRWKQQLLADAGIDIPPSVTFVPMDFERADPGDALRLAGFRADQAACISWMGVTMYLTEDAVLRTLGALAALAQGTCLCFDYRVPATALDATARVALEVIEARVAALGEPWLSTFYPAHLRSRLLGLGFSSAQTATADELNQRYFARRQDGLCTGGGSRIMCAIT